MSVWNQAYEDFRRPYYEEEKKAKKDYDGDGKVESGSKEHAGAVHNAIQRAKGGKADGQDTRKEEAVAEGSMKQARKNVGASTCWDGYKAKGTKKKNGRDVPNCVKEDELEEAKRGLYANIHAKRRRGEKPAKPGDKDYPKTLNVEGVRDPDPKKGTEERKARLEKKRGHKVDDHPQYKKEEMEHAEKVEFYGEVYTITNADVKGNTPAFRNYKAGMKSKIDGKPLYQLAPHVKLANSYEPEGDAIDEGSMKAARKNVGASTCWKGYKAKGTKEKNGRIVPNCVKEYSDWRQEMGEGFFSEAAKTEKLDIQTSGVKNKIEINPQLKTEGACSDKPMERLKTDRDGYRVPQKDADAAKARILAKTKKKRQQAKENIMKGALLPQTSDNSMLDSVEEQALQMIERTRYAKETGKDYKTGNKSEKGGTRDGKSAFDKVSREMRKTGGMMSSRGKAIQPQGKKKQPGKKGYQGVTPVDKIKGKLAQKKRNANHNPYKPRQGESD